MLKIKYNFTLKNLKPVEYVNFAGIKLRILTDSCDIDTKKMKKAGRNAARKYNKYIIKKLIGELENIINTL